MGITPSPHTHRLRPPGSSLAAQGYDPDTSLFSIFVLVRIAVVVCVLVFVRL